MYLHVQFQPALKKRELIRKKSAEKNGAALENAHPPPVGCALEFEQATKWLIELPGAAAKLWVAHLTAERFADCPAGPCGPTGP